MSARSSASGVELGCLGGEVVVEIGKDLLPDLLHRDREARVLAGKLLDPVVLGKGHLDLVLAAGLGAGELLLEPLDELPASELEQLVVALAAFEQLAVNRAGEIDQQHIAVGARLARPARAAPCSRGFAPALGR